MFSQKSLTVAATAPETHELFISSGQHDVTRTTNWCEAIGVQIGHFYAIAVSTREKKRERRIHSLPEKYPSHVSPKRLEKSSRIQLGKLETLKTKFTASLLTKVFAMNV